MRATPLFVLFATLTLGCSGSADQAGAGPAATGPAPGGAGGAIDAPTGDEGSAPPAYGRITPAGFVLDADEGVKLSGTLRYVGQAEPVGTLMLEISVDPGPDGETAGPIHVQELEGLGEWALQVPEDLGPIKILAYYDADMNGPGPEEPKGHYDVPINVGSEAIPGIDFIITDEAPAPPDPDAPPPNTTGDEFQFDPKSVDGEMPPLGEAEKGEPPLMIIKSTADAANAVDAPTEEAPAEEAPATEATE
jgi:hypothetical protein